MDYKKGRRKGCSREKGKIIIIRRRRKVFIPCMTKIQTIGISTSLGIGCHLAHTIHQDNRPSLKNSLP
jgi:hypothetical protein